MAAPVILFCHSYVSPTLWTPSHCPVWQFNYPAPLPILQRPTSCLHLYALAPAHSCMFCGSAGDCGDTNMLTDSAYRNRTYRMVREKRPGSGFWNKYKKTARLTFVRLQGDNYLLTGGGFHRQIVLLLSIEDIRPKACPLSIVTDRWTRRQVLQDYILYQHFCEKCKYPHYVAQICHIDIY